MKAIVYSRYGSPEVLRLEEVETPAPAGGEILVRVHAAASNAADWHLMRGDPFLVRFMCGLFRPGRPTILGADVAGVVEAVGQGVTRFAPGDRVFGDLGFSGAFAEYACTQPDRLAPIPDGVGFEEAAATPLAGVTALQALRDKGRIQAGQRVLVNGASGGVGHFAVQIARAIGAQVTGVCSTRNLDLVRAVGADHVVDYTESDFTRGGATYDLILDAAAYRRLSDYRRILAPEGTYVLVGGAFRRLLEVMLLGRWVAMTSRQRMVSVMAESTQEDLMHLRGLLESGALRPAIDRRYPLSAVPDAIRYMETGRARGKVVITVAPAAEA